MFKLKPERINFNESIGEGGSGSVYNYPAHPNDNRWVVKVIRANSIPHLQFLLQEVVIGYSCDHPAILPVKGFCLETLRPTGINLYIKLPKMKETLRDVMGQYTKKKEIIPEQKIIKYFHTIVSGLEYLHGRRIVHRDIKPENVLVGFKGELQLSDVGGAKIVENEDATNIVTEIIGTKAYVASEIFGKKDLKKGDLFKADIWSLGVLMVELCTLESFTKQYYPFSEGELRGKLASIQGRYNEELINLIHSLISDNPDERKTAEQVRATLEALFGDKLEDEAQEQAEEVIKQTFKEETKEVEVVKRKATFFQTLTKTFFKSDENAGAPIERKATFSKTFLEKPSNEKWQDFFNVKAVGFDIEVLKRERYSFYLLLI